MSVSPLATIKANSSDRFSMEKPIGSPASRGKALLTAAVLRVRTHILPVLSGWAIRSTSVHAILSPCFDVFGAAAVQWNTSTKRGDAVYRIPDGEHANVTRFP